MTDFQQYFDKSHQLIRDSVRRFVEREVLPHIDEWGGAEEFPYELYPKADTVRILGIDYPEAYSDSCEDDLFAKVAASEEFVCCGSDGLVAGLGSLDIRLPSVVKWVHPEVREWVVPVMLRGEKIMALAVTGPSGGSDVANLKTHVVCDGDHYHVSDSETFITSGTHTDYYTVAVCISGGGSAGISLLLVEEGTAGFSAGRKLEKMDWWAPDTAELFFDDCRVPTGNLVGVENAGFAYIMASFQSERLALAVMTSMTTQLALGESLRWACEREAFGKPIGKLQVLHHRPAGMTTQLEVSHEFTYRRTAKMAAGKSVVKEISMVKDLATDVANRLTYDAVQVLGGMGYMHESLVKRLCRGSRILSIGGGSWEITNEIISKQMGL